MRGGRTGGEGGGGFGMKGQREGKRVWEISAHTQMLESGHANLLLHKNSKISHPSAERHGQKHTAETLVPPGGRTQRERTLEPGTLEAWMLGTHQSYIHVQQFHWNKQKQR